MGRAAPQARSPAAGQIRVLDVKTRAPAPAPVPAPVAAPAAKPKPLRVMLADGGYTTVLIAGSDTAADLAVKVACKRESQCFTIAVKEKTGASSFVAGNTVLQSLI